MRKTLLLLLIGCIGITSGQASTSFLQDGKTATTQAGNIQETSSGRPRAPRRQQTPFSISYDSGLCALVVTPLADVGLVHAFIENLDTGAVCIYSFNSSLAAVLPISGEAGIWRIILCNSTKWPFITELAI
jgi:hypothetical protein